jgi:threonine/homoserine/homoserine lactone efflux protein
MTAEVLLALVGFALVTSITPGPNNVMLLASGVNFGFRRSIPHMLGIGIGFMVMLLSVGVGVGRVFEMVPGLDRALKIACVVYMLWLAAQIATAKPISHDETATGGRPMTLLGAAAFQWVNPKAWAIALTATATYTTASQYMLSLVVLALVFCAVTVPSVGLWTLFGVGLRRTLADPVKLRLFNWSMAVLLVASLYPIAIALMR